MIESWAVCERCGHREVAVIDKKDDRPIHPTGWLNVVRNPDGNFVTIFACVSCMDERRALIDSWYPLKKDN